MLRASITLQLENDTRRLCPMSMNRKKFYREFKVRFGSPRNAAGLVLGKTTKIRRINLHSLTNFE